MTRFVPARLLRHLAGLLAWATGLVWSAGATAQERPPPTPPPRIELRENVPNPFFPTTTIPFVIHPSVCEGGHRPLVSLKIYNVLVQQVAVPILQGVNEPLTNLRLPCGSYDAFWDGHITNNGKELTPGVYYAQLTIDNSERATIKMIARR